MAGLNRVAPNSRGGTYSVQTPASMRTTNTDTSTKNTTPAPSKASAAPKGNTKYNFLGLCEALNQYEKDLVKSGTVEIANSYEVQFVPESLGSSKVKIPGQTEKSTTPMQQDGTAKSKIDSNTNSMNTTAMNKSVLQGTQIVQYIETVMRNSSYITDQQKSSTDAVDGKNTPNDKSNSDTSWFKINVQAYPLSDKLDKKRNDYAYHMVYIVNTYGINEMKSQYFPPAKFKGIHKVYDYWFTGMNTQVLHFEQSFNNLWIEVMTGTAPIQSTDSELAKKIQFQNKRVPMTRTSETDQGASKGAMNPASTAADFLYSFADQSGVSIKIIGDPAWIQQGTITTTNAKNFSFDGFYPDGTVNTEAQQAVFAINWNAPADYNLDTGLVDINAEAGGSNNLSNADAQASTAYTLLAVKSTFKKGLFEQELAGTILTNLHSNDVVDAGKQSSDKAAAEPAATPTGGGRSSAKFAATDPRRVDLPQTGGGRGSAGFSATDPRRVDLNSSKNQNTSSWQSPSSATPASNTNSSTSLPSPKTSSPAGQPVSNNTTVSAPNKNSSQNTSVNKSTQVMAPKDQ